MAPPLPPVYRPCELEINTKLESEDGGKVEVVQLLTSGNYGTVFQAIYRPLSGPPQEVAIKSFNVENTQKKAMKHEIDIMNVSLLMVGSNMYRQYNIIVVITFDSFVSSSETCTSEHCENYHER